MVSNIGSYGPTGLTFAAKGDGQKLTRQLSAFFFPPTVSIDFQTGHVRVSGILTINGSATHTDARGNSVMNNVSYEYDEYGNEIDPNAVRKPVTNVPVIDVVVEQSKVTPPQEPPRVVVEPPKVEKPKLEPPKPEPPKVVQPPKVEKPKPEPPKPEPPKVVQPPKVEKPKPVALKDRPQNSWTTDEIKQLGKEVNPGNHDPNNYSVIMPNHDEYMIHKEYGQISSTTYSGNFPGTSYDNPGGFGYGY